MEQEKQNVLELEKERERLNAELKTLGEHFEAIKLQNITLSNNNATLKEHCDALEKETEA